MWEYGEPIHPHNRQRLNCELCGKEIYGGISHLKYHLAKIVEHEEEVCFATTPKIMRIANQSLWLGRGMRRRNWELNLHLKHNQEAQEPQVP